MRAGPNVRYCPTARNFYLIRRVLMETLALPRAAIRPTSTFAELVPASERQRVHRHFVRHRLNVLELSLSRAQLAAARSMPLLAGFAVSLVLAALLSGATLLIGLECSPDLTGFVGCASLAGGFIAACLTLNMILSRATEIDPTFTVRDAVVRGTRMRDYLNAGYELSSRDELFIKVCDIIGRNLGVDPDKLTEKTNFQEDLGVD